MLTGTLIAIHAIAFMLLMGRASSITPLRVFNLLYINLDTFALVSWFLVLMRHAFNY